VDGRWGVLLLTVWIKRYQKNETGTSHTLATVSPGGDRGTGSVTIIFLTHPPEARARYYGERALAGLRVLGEVRFNPLGRVLTAAELVDAAQHAALIVSDRQTPGYAEAFDRLTGLVAFLRVAVDFRNIDLEAANRNGVLVTHASPGFQAAVAEWILGAMVDLARHVTDYAAAYRATGRQPAARMGRQLSGATLGVVGYGEIGRTLCQAAGSLGMRVLVHDPYVKIADAGVEQVAFEALLAEADFVVPLATATPETENLFDAAAFDRMKPGAYFINASRGNLVDEAALAAALDGKRVAGAAIDVGRAPDQMPTPALARRSDVIATPHIAGLTPEAIAHQALETVAQAADILAGRMPQGAVNPQQATRFATRRTNVPT
jgi:D-3-phosphoglycerate dehydrogenase / 2-oxoglutarate reductase